MLPRLLLALSGSLGWLSVRLSLSALAGCPESFVGSSGCRSLVGWSVGRSALPESVVAMLAEAVVGGGCSGCSCLTL